MLHIFILSLIVLIHKQRPVRAFAFSYLLLDFVFIALDGALSHTLTTWLITNVIYEVAGLSLAISILNNNWQKTAIVSVMGVALTFCITSLATGNQDYYLAVNMPLYWSIISLMCVNAIKINRHTILNAF